MFQSGDLLYFNPFHFPDGGLSKPKYFLVLAEMESRLLLASLPTSKDHVPSDIPLSAGCLELPERMVNVFVMMANTPVTTNGFSFRVNTFIYGANIKTYSSSLFIQQMENGETEISVVGRLTEELFSDLKDCLKNSDAVRKRYKNFL